MQFQHYDLGHMSTGEIVEVSLAGNAANVLLLDPTNLSHFRRGRQCRYFGGHQTSSVGHLRIPNSGHWHVVINLGGYAGRVRASVRKIH
jgi:hypothetical protein